MSYYINDTMSLLNKKLLTVLTALVSAALGAAVPSAPLFVTDTMFSLWAPGGELVGRQTEHWSGEPQTVRANLSVDGKDYLLMSKGPGEPAVCGEPEIGATRTRFALKAGPVAAELVFFTPAIPDDLDVFSRPVSYLRVKLEATDGRAHDLKLAVTALGDMAAQDWHQDGLSEPVSLPHAKGVRIGRLLQFPFSRTDDMTRPDWGYFHLASADATRAVADSETRMVCNMTATLAWDFGKVRSATAKVAAAFDDVEGLMFLNRKCPGWWARDGKPFATMLGEAIADFDRLDAKTAAFDRDFSGKCERVGGAKYADIAELAWRQSFGACKLVTGSGRQPLYFSKENASNGSMGTVDVFYPQLPHLLYASLPLVRATLEPILVYANSSGWKHDFAPHDVGTYPIGNHQTYAWEGPDAPGTSSMMPVEECGNMLLCLGALSAFEGNADYASRWWPTVKKWADYLEKVGVDPGNQLCTDDFAGHLDHNANLSVKTILGLAAYAKMCEMRGEKGEADRLLAKARQMAEDWCARAAGGLHGSYRLAFDQADSWSMKYNLVWDRVLGLGVFPGEVAKRELAAYRKILATGADPFGLPLDSRGDPRHPGRRYTKCDWIVWSACLTGERADFDALIAPLHHYIRNTKSQVPFSDWYYSDNGDFSVFRGRSVVGGVMLPLLEGGRKRANLP